MFGPFPMLIFTIIRSAILRITFLLFLGSQAPISQSFITTDFLQRMVRQLNIHTRIFLAEAILHLTGLKLTFNSLCFRPSSSYQIMLFCIQIGPYALACLPLPCVTVSVGEHRIVVGHYHVCLVDAILMKLLFP